MLKYLLLSAVTLISFGAFAGPREQMEKALVQYVETRHHKSHQMAEKHKDDIQAAAHDFSSKCSTVQAEKLARYFNTQVKGEGGPNNPHSNIRLKGKCREAGDAFWARMQELHVVGHDEL